MAHIECSLTSIKHSSIKQNQTSLLFSQLKPIHFSTISDGILECTFCHPPFVSLEQNTQSFADKPGILEAK